MIGAIGASRETMSAVQTALDIAAEYRSIVRDDHYADADRLAAELAVMIEKVRLFAMLDEARRR